jgi:hypothetical protein
VTYNNSYNTGLNGVKIILKNSSGVILGQVYSGPNPGNTNKSGFYTFVNIPDGDYNLSASYTGAWGGNNATDALIIELYTVGLYPLAGLYKIAGDVNNDFIVNATDALWVKLRTVGIVNSYPAGDWKFTDTTFSLISADSINLKGLCVGDVNGSYIPTGEKESSFLSVTNDGMITVPVNHEFDYLIRGSINTDLGAMTLFMGYDPDRFEIVKINTLLDGMKYTIRDGMIRLAWSNTTPMSLKENDPVLTFTMKAKEPVNIPSQIFDVKEGSEFADRNARRYDDFKLKMPGIVTLSNPAGFSIFNFPNPFWNTTDIVYTLPEQGHVILTLTNIFGDVIRTLVNSDQLPGTYTIKLDPSDNDLLPGIYLYSIRVDGVNSTFNKIDKMIFTR